jgi:SAM-dependent methyltransferase
MTSIAQYGRGLTSAALHRLERLLLRTRVGIQGLTGVVGHYQPNPFREEATSDRRACRARFLAFSAALPAGVPLSCLDIGCNAGYFTFRMAEAGGICLGLDIGRNEISYARGLAALHGVRNVAFLQFEITPHNVAALPHTDVIICMSVFHHWVRKLGLEQATRIVDGLARRCRFLVFETGQHNESDTTWAPDLAFMGEDCDAWVRRFLSDRGFKSVTGLGNFSTTLSSVPRHLYLAEKPAP